jgi:2-oxoglutarate dehydrogenase E2 component (dihydrolipoamide succinyltransferase)
MNIEIIVPTLGESITEATVAKWFKAVGESFNVDDPLVELETDKVTVEVPASTGGTLVEIVAEEGAEVEVGAVLGFIGDGRRLRPRTYHRRSSAWSPRMTSTRRRFQPPARAAG